MVATFYFPKEEPEFYTRLSMRKYSRSTPGSPTTTSLQTSIRLPLPTNLTDSFNIDVSGANMELLGSYPMDNGAAGLMAAGKSLSEQFKSMSQDSSSGMVSGIMKMVGQVAALTPQISDTGLGKFSQSQVGMVRNPHLTTIFEGVKLKTYTFSWKISPKSAAEAQQLNEMIKYIKGYMHPQIIGASFALEYPYLASIQFVVGNSAHMPNVKDSFITGFSINNAGSGAPAFYKDGNPVSTELSLSFQEIDIQTRDDFLGTNNDPGLSIQGRNSPNNP